MVVCLFPSFDADWLDLWVSDRRHSNRIQDALQRMEINLLHAFETSLQRISSNQSFRPSAPSSSVGSWLCRDLPQPPLPSLVWLRWWSSQMATKTLLHQHHRLSLHFTPAHCLLLTSRHLPPHRKIHHPDGNILPDLMTVMVPFFVLK